MNNSSIDKLYANNWKLTNDILLYFIDGVLENSTVTL